jgi:hypothetical protein
MIGIIMNTAIVIDSSTEISSKLFSKFNIYPLGYVVRDSNNETHLEKTKIQTLETSKLLSIIAKDKQAELFAPSIKEFVELYTYLAEEYDSLISVHSSLATPVVFENALVAKKMVSEITIDVIDTHTLGSSSGLFVDELSKFISTAKNINEIRKEAISLDKHINSFIVTRNGHLNSNEIERINWRKNLTLSFKQFHLFNYFHNSWNTVSNSRNAKSLFGDIQDRLDVITQTKDLKSIYYSTSSNFSSDTKNTLNKLKKIPITETYPSLVAAYLLGDTYFDISFV